MEIIFRNGGPTMEDHIQQVIKQLELDFNVKILFACESGSRAWGFPSKDSDYDVRFIYIHRQDWYLSIDSKRDVIEVPKNDHLSIPVHELLDLSGWELTKALRLFRKSNPPMLEWLHSSMVYYQAFSLIERMKAIEEDIFSPASGVYHYLNMAKGNFREYLQGEQVKIKKYFYVLRPVFAAKWIQRYNTVPPIEFQALLEEIIPPGELKEAAYLLLERKMNGDELNLEPRIDVINQYLKEEIDHLEHYAKTLKIHQKDPTDKLNTLFRQTLEEAWQ